MSKECQVGPGGLEQEPTDGGLGQQQQQEEEVVVGEQYTQQDAFQATGSRGVAGAAAAEGREVGSSGQVLVQPSSSSRRGGSNDGKGGQQIPSSSSSSRGGTADQQARGMAHEAGGKTIAARAAAAVAIVPVLPLPSGHLQPAAAGAAPPVAAAGVGSANRLITQGEPVVIFDMAQYQASPGMGGIGVVPLHLPLLMSTAAEAAKKAAAFGSAAAADDDPMDDS